LFFIEVVCSSENHETFIFQNDINLFLIEFRVKRSDRLGYGALRYAKFKINTF
jgi:hypothetical protein